MRILVTGGAGYLGAVLVPKLLAYGYHVTVLDSFRHGVPSLTAVSANRNLTIVRGDLVLGSHELFCNLIDDAEGVVHLAALVGAPLCDSVPLDTVELNTVITEVLVRRLRPDQPIIFPCTNSGYGKGGVAPVTESDPMTPLSLYGTTKVRAEEAVLRHKLGVSLRLATLYGPSPRMRLDLLVNDFVYRAVRGEELKLYEPHFRRCVLHVSDAAEAISLALENADTLCGKPYNVGAENVTKNALCQMIYDQVAGFEWSAAEGHDPDQRDYDVSWQAFHTAAGWGPLKRVQEGITELIRLYQQPFDGPQWRNA